MFYDNGWGIGVFAACAFALCFEIAAIIANTNVGGKLFKHMRGLIIFLLKFEYIRAIVESLVSINQSENLTPKHLIDLGWVKENGFFVEKSIKDRDKIWIEFEDSFFRVYHGKDKTFIALNKKKSWFDSYYSLIND